MSTPTSVYRYFDLEGRIIYVGVTSRGPQRQAQHAVTADWWPYVSTQDVEHLPTREAALKREKWLIEHHQPPFNRQHNPDWERLRAAYIARHGSACEAAEVCDKPEDCYAYVAGINSAWCGVHGCKPCHIRWHGYQDGVEAALDHVSPDVYLILDTLTRGPDPFLAQLAANVFAAGTFLLEVMETKTGDEDPVQMKRLDVIRENFLHLTPAEGAPF